MRRLAVFSICLILGGLFGQSLSAELRLGIIAPRAQQELSDLLLLALEDRGGTSFVERVNLAELVQENRLNDSGFVARESLQRGRIAGAEALLVMVPLTAGNASLLNIRLIDVRAGLVRFETFLESELDDPLAAMERLVERLDQALVAIGQPLESDIRLVVDPIHFLPREARWRDWEASFNTLLVHRLRMVPGLLVLERDRIQDIMLEFSLEDSDRAESLPQGSQVLEGQIRQEGTDLFVNLMMPGNRDPGVFEARGDPSEMRAIIEVIARQVEARFELERGLARPLESDWLVERTRWQLQTGQFTEAREGFFTLHFLEGDSADVRFFRQELGVRLLRGNNNFSSVRERWEFAQEFAFFLLREARSLPQDETLSFSRVRYFLDGAELTSSVPNPSWRRSNPEIDLYLPVTLAHATALINVLSELSVDESGRPSFLPKFHDQVGEFRAVLAIALAETLEDWWAVLVRNFHVVRLSNQEPIANFDRQGEWIPFLTQRYTQAESPFEEFALALEIALKAEDARIRQIGAGLVFEKLAHQPFLSSERERLFPHMMGWLSRLNRRMRDNGDFSDHWVREPAVLIEALRAGVTHFQPGFPELFVSGPEDVRRVIQAIRQRLAEDQSLDSSSTTQLQNLEQILRTRFDLSPDLRMGQAVKPLLFWSFFLLEWEGLNYGRHHQTIQDVTYANGYLWVLGSYWLARVKPDAGGFTEVRGLSAMGPANVRGRLLMGQSSVYVLTRNAIQVIGMHDLSLTSIPLPAGPEYRSLVVEEPYAYLYSSGNSGQRVWRLNLDTSEKKFTDLPFGDTRPATNQASLLSGKDHLYLPMLLVTGGIDVSGILIIDKQTLEANWLIRGDRRPAISPMDAPGNIFSVRVFPDRGLAWILALRREGAARVYAHEYDEETKNWRRLSGDEFRWFQRLSTHYASTPSPGGMSVERSGTFAGETERTLVRVGTAHPQAVLEVKFSDQTVPVRLNYQLNDQQRSTFLRNAPWLQRLSESEGLRRLGEIYEGNSMRAIYLPIGMILLPSIGDREEGFFFFPKESLESALRD
jgi:hypothetical protein